MEILKLIRVKHWVKNFFVFVPLVFAQKFTDAASVENAVALFFLFSFAASLIYVVNDIHDVEKDKKHPVKKNRPLASGKISTLTAYAVISVLIFLIIAFSVFFRISPAALKVVAAYVFVNFLYTYKLKQIPVVDILTISSGYVMRIYAGAFAIDVPVSQWLIVSVLFLSLFLAALKRGAEFRKSRGTSETRKVLESYSEDVINSIISVSTTGVILSYLLYTVSDKIYSEFHSYNFIVTSIFVIYGLFRTLLLYYKEERGEDAFELVLRDVPSLVNLILYVIAVFYLIYF